MKIERTRPLHGAALAVSLLAALSSPRFAAADDADVPRRDVVWASESNRIPLWISLDLLMADEASVNGPLTQDELIANRETMLDRPARTSCMPAELYPDPSPPATPVNLLDLLTGNQLSALGRIDHVELGWSPFLERVMTLVYVRVEELFVDRSGRYVAGDILTLLDPAGEITLPRGRLCTQKPEGSYRPRPGDLVAIVGAPQRPDDPTDSIVSCPYCIFPVSQDRATGDLMIHPPTSGIFEVTPVSVDAVRSRVQER